MTNKRKTTKSKRNPTRTLTTKKQIRTTAPATKIVFTWEAPDESLLEDRRGTLPQFPCDVFPPGLSDWLSRASRGAGTLIDHIAVPMLGVTSSLIGKARRVQASTAWIVPMTLWTCVVGQSGNRKTPGLKVITRALDQIETENKPIYRDASAAHVARVEKAKVEMKRWRKECEEAINANREPPRMPIEAVDPGDFIWPALYVTECTIQRLARLCMVRPRGMMQIRDELAALFSSFRLSGARSFYLEAWDGEKFVVECVDDDRTFTVDNLLVGVIGGFQPDKLARAFTGDEDGMYGRFLYGWPLTPEYSPLTDDISEVDPEFQNLLTKLIRLPAENEHGEFAPLIIPLSTEAREEFEHYRRFVDQEKRGIEGREQQWLAKSEAHLLRLAGTLAYLAWADASPGTSGLESIAADLEPNEIDRQSMVNAVRLMQQYFWPHARAALRQIGLTDRHRHIRRILRWVRANNRHEVSLRDIRRDALGESVDVEQTRDLFDRMGAAGWVRAMPIVKTGGRPKERWTINPQLFKPYSGFGGFGDTENEENGTAPKTLPLKPPKPPKATSTKKRRRT
jgi:Protein of unknown function (DUF3987)